MTIKQISVFLENKAGRLDEVLKTLADNNINIVAMSLADTADYGMLRLVVSEPDKAVNVLKDRNLMAQLVDVVAFHVPHATGSLYKAMQVVVDAGVNIEYMYAFGINEEASVILKTKMAEQAVKALEASGVGIWNPEQAYKLNQ